MGLPWPLRHAARVATSYVSMGGSGGGTRGNGVRVGRSICSGTPWYGSGPVFTTVLAKFPLKHGKVVNSVIFWKKHRKVVNLVVFWKRRKSTKRANASVPQTGLNTFCTISLKARV